MRKEAPRDTRSMQNAEIKPTRCVDYNFIAIFLAILRLILFFEWSTSTLSLSTHVVDIIRVEK
jgi:hypothetical protein